MTELPKPEPQSQQPAIKVTVLLEHHKGDKRWSASVPLIEGCAAEGDSPEEAAHAVLPEIEYYTLHDPELLEELREEPEFMITEVNFPINETNLSPIDLDVKPTA